MNLFVFPGNIEDDILAVGAQQLPYMRTAFFSELVKESEQMLLNLIGCVNGRVLFYTGSGTAAMDAVVTNYVTTKSKALVIAGGSFGYRWSSLCDYYGCNHTVHKVEFGKDINYSLLEEEICMHRPEVLLCQHHETSSGQLYDLKRIGDLCKKYKVSLVVDAISSFLSDPLHMSELGIDICLTSSQKGLNILPGLSIVVLSDKLNEYEFNSRGYYLDFKENLKNLTRGQTPYSPATSLFLQMHERLKRNSKLGLDYIINSVKEKALFFRGLCAEYGWVTLAENPSNCITGFFVKTNSDKLFEELMEKGFVIMPGSVSGFFRVSHLGLQSKQDLINLAHAIDSLSN